MNTFQLFLCLGILTLVSSQQFIGCYVPGRCENSQIVSAIPSIPNVEECLYFCQETEDCRYFTYEIETDICLAFHNCVNLTTETCHDCISGHKRCPPNQCFLPGKCEGEFVSIVVTGSMEGCLQECLANDVCGYFSFDSNGLCTLTVDCQVADCSTCVYGKRDCHHATDVWSKILVAGGSNGTHTLFDAEVIDMSKIEQTCGDPTDYPLARIGMVAALVDNLPWFCGGSNTNLCHNYYADSKSWSPATPMLKARYRPATSIIRGGTEWWITGGANGSLVHDATEILRNGIFVPGPDLTEPLFGHCLVSINHTHVFMAGGTSNTSISGKNGKAFVLNLDSGLGWQQVQDMSVARFGPVCSLITNTDFGDEILVTGGPDEITDIYSVTDFTRRAGPPFPNPVYLPVTLPYLDSFLVVGGSFGTFYDTIYKFNVQEWKWDLMLQTLNEQRDNFAGVILPDDLVDCN